MYQFCLSTKLTKFFTVDSFFIMSFNGDSYDARDGKLKYLVYYIFFNHNCNRN